MRTIRLPHVLACVSFIFGGLLCEAREIHDLNGEWEFSFEGAPAKKVIIPHTWNVEDACAGPKSGKHTALSVQSKSYARGTGRYTRTVPVEKKAGKRYFVRGEGASIVSEVFINGKSAGTHAGAFGAFCYEITDLLNTNSENTVTVSANNSYNDDILPLSGDFSMFGGLYRPIALIETDTLCINPAYFASPGVFIKQKNVSSASAEISVETLLSGVPKSPAEIAVLIKDSAGKIVARKKITSRVPENREERIPVSLKITRPQLWQGVENPYLYSVEVSVLGENGTTDTVVQPLGIRTFEITPDRGFILNGRAGTLRGVCRHQDMEGKGWAMSAKDEIQDIALIVEMGANALRTAHYPQTENIYDLCDREGIVVWSEVPAIEKVRSRPAFIENMKLQAKEMVLQHGNHPSICMWGIFNEIFHQVSAEDRKVDMIPILEDLNKYLHALDPSRPTVAATNQGDSNRLNKIADHLAANMYPGWYGGGPERMGGMIDGYLRNNPDRGFAVSEYGHGADIAAHEYPVKRPQPTSKWHPEEWQAYGHEINYHAIKNRPKLWGTFIWNMFDFATAERIEGAKAGMNDKGLITYDRKTKKDAFYFYKANWNSDPMVHVVSKRFFKRPAGIVEVKAYTNAERADLFINGKKVGNTQKPDNLKIVRWESAEIKSGKNKIEVRAHFRNGKRLADSCTWTCP